MTILGLINNQIFLSAFYKGATGVFIFLTVSLLISFLGDTSYGVWVLVFSMFQWSLFFDFGITNVLKSKIPEFTVRKVPEKINTYISVSYILTFFLAVSIFLVFFLFVKNMGMAAFFNIRLPEPFLFRLFMINGIFFCINIVFSVNKSLFVGVHKNHLSEQAAMVSQVLFLVVLAIVFLFLKEESQTEKMLWVTYINGSVTLFVNGFYTFLFFRKHAYTLTVINTAEFKSTSREIITMGLRFMIIQVFMVIIFFSDPYLISHYLNPEDVSRYDVITKLFQFPLMVILSGLSSMWPMFAKHYHEKDYGWIKKSFSKFHSIMILILIAIVILGLLSNTIISLWIGKENYIANTIVYSIVMMTFLRVFFTFYANFFNGIGKLKSQIYLMGGGALLKIPLTIYLLKNNFGIASVLLITSLFLLIWSIVLFLQTKSIIND
nr:MATE family efflux transporter [uncultured Flavobacterium sp.]